MSLLQLSADRAANGAAPRAFTTVSFNAVPADRVADGAAPQSVRTAYVERVANGAAPHMVFRCARYVLPMVRPRARMFVVTFILGLCLSWFVPFAGGPW